MGAMTPDVKRAFTINELRAAEGLPPIAPSPLALRDLSLLNSAIVERESFCQPEVPSHWGGFTPEELSPQIQRKPLPSEKLT